MLTKRIIFPLLLTLFFSISSYSQESQVKIGYTNAEFILSNMPEAKAMQRELTRFEKELAMKLGLKQKRYQQLLMEIGQVKENLRSGVEVDMEDIKRKESEMNALSNEIKTMAEESEQQLLLKEQELAQPIIAKLQKAIDEVAASNGYTYILNQTTSAGVSTLLYGPESDDVTELIAEKLEIEFPEE